MRLSFVVPKKMAAGLFAAVFLPGQLLSAREGATANLPVLVELFTSEGCSSCPPADRLLAELDQKQPIPGVSVIVLSEHVDYWNSGGWRDPFSSRQWSDRQSDYASRFKLDSSYTPQMVVDGAHQVNGSDGRAVVTAIKESAELPTIPIGISSMVRTGDTIQTEFTAGAAPGAVLYAVLADDSDRSSVKHGENAGRTLDHVAVAHDLIRVAKLEAGPVSKRIDIKIPAQAVQQRLRLVLFAQDGKTGRVLAVTAREL
jgi:hypothetical protein